MNIKNRKSYMQFSILYDKLTPNATKATILQAVYEMLDAYKAFGSQTHADFAKESLEQLLKDKGPEIQFNQGLNVDPDNIPNDWDEVEIHPVIDLGDGVCEVCDPKDASFYSAYLHNTKGGIECIADFLTEESANAFAHIIETISNNYKQP